MDRGTDEPRERPLTKAEVDRRIAALRTCSVPHRSTPENLDLPLDPRIRVDAHNGRNTLVLVVDGVDVSWATVVDFVQQIGISTVRMGGIAGVGTRDDQRFKGYSRCVMENCLRWMRKAGYHTSMLYGIPSYYPKFGYAKAFPQVRFSLAVRDAEASDGGTCFTIVPFDVDRHLEAILDMYAANHAGRTGVTRRCRETWRPFRKGLAWNSRAIVDVFEDGGGRAAGYLVFDDKHLTANVIEAGFADPSVFPAMLRRAADFAWEQRLENLQLHLPEDDLFANYCRAFGCTTQMSCSRDGGGMVRLINVGAALNAIADELSTRARGSGCVNLETNTDSASLEWTDGHLVVGQSKHQAPTVRMPQWAAAQLVYGYRHVSALSADGAIEGPADVLADLAGLFPVRAHYQLAVDHF